MISEDRNAPGGGRESLQAAAGERPVAVIMAGGMGTRFWPLSTREKPKQFLRLFDDRSLLQKSFDRIEGMIPPERILVLTNAAFVSLVREQLPGIPGENVVGEPMRRDTAAAAALAAFLCAARFGDPVMVLLTADHLIGPADLFRKTILSAVRAARERKILYTLGIRPTRPATGYGYIELGPAMGVDGGIEHYRVSRFKEKPDGETARKYVESGNYLWNSGMFVWTAEAIREALETHLPEHCRILSRAVRDFGTPRWEKALREAFGVLTPVSIDYGVMEKVNGAGCVRSEFSWNDVGGWLALQDYLARDDEGNCACGNLVCGEARGNLVYCEDPGETVLLLGVDDLVVIRSGSRTLVVPKDRIEEIKDIVQSLEKG